MKQSNARVFLVKIPHFGKLWADRGSDADDEAIYVFEPLRQTDAVVDRVPK
jgi:hypothetical protein